MKHIRNKQSEQQADVKGTDPVPQMAIQEPRDEDGEQNNKTQGTPYPPRKKNARATREAPPKKEEASAPPAAPPKKGEPSEPGTAKSETATPHAPATSSFIWQPPAELDTPGFNAIGTGHHSLRRSSNGQVAAEAEGTVW